ncbi:uncharacterized protein LOC128762798 [Synchiropus splendidus]|uniref:uncharacterized protein LOC128762798 n=1 Tax=Synchiropus splendidus TaxID=270530 RepID=UPI00237D7478|nr:uncharacterized protein LOC128762798 [Synchiropus splendidus]
MKVFCCVLLLVAGLALGTSAPAHEDCQEHTKVMPLSDLSKLHGKMNFIMGFNGHKLERHVVELMNSGTIHLAAAEHGGVILTQELKVNGTCMHLVINATIEHDTAVGNIMDVLTNRYTLYESPDGTLVTAVNSTHTKAKTFLKRFSVDKEFDGEDELNTRSFYVFANEKVVSDETKEHFKKQAACLGFHDPPSFIYDGVTDICPPPETH